MKTSWRLRNWIDRKLPKASLDYSQLAITYFSFTVSLFKIPAGSRSFPCLQYYLSWVFFFFNNKCWRQFAFALVFVYFALWLVGETCATFSINEQQNKIKINWHARVFSRFTPVTYICFEFRLVDCAVCVCCGIVTHQSYFFGFVVNISQNPPNCIAFNPL